MKISHKLRMKIISTGYEGINVEQHYNDIHIAGSIPIKIPLYKEIELSLDLSNNLDLFKECAKWMDMGMTGSVVADIGPFVGLFPTEVNINNNTVTFTADEYNENKQDWKDWFVMEEN
jgi:hypothetical protein